MLATYNADIPKYIKKFHPAGLTNWMLFNKHSTNIIGKSEIINKITRHEFDRDVMYRGYDDYYPMPKDGTYEAVAKSIISYLEVYDKYLTITKNEETEE